MTRHKKIVSTKTTMRVGVLLTVFFCWLFLSIPPVAAQSVAETNSELNQGVAIIQQPLGLASTDIRLIIANIVRAALGLLGIVLLVLFLYGGYLYMTSGGNEEQIASAKKILLNAVIGLAIILSAYAIVLFVMRLLGLGSGSSDGGSNISAPAEQSFAGSGALGAVIKDHYPARDQKDVPRNTKIVITFRQPIDPDSFIVNSNQSTDAAGNPIYGDCLNVGSAMNWETDCDRIKPGGDFITITRADTKDPIRGAAVLASYENGKLYTIVIRPYDNLGSATDKIAYLVHIGKGLTINDPANGGQSIFKGIPVGRDFYEWQFVCDTILDTMAPRVSDVFPAAGSTEAKNSAIQINFSEAMDPTGIQGTFATTTNYYTLQGNTIFLKSGNSSRPLGTFRLTNAYRTLEFTPSKECGDNACGGKIYCLSVCDQSGANCTQDSYELLVRAAKTFSTNSFESVPFSGAMDLSGNALDSSPYGAVQVAPTSTPIFPNQKAPDNYFWSFTLTNTVDLTAPFIKQVSPGVEATYINPYAPWSLLFSKRMRIDPLYNITIQEKPVPTEPLCRVPRVSFNADGTTLADMQHCPFLNQERHYYYPIIDSSIEDIHFNCFYPGKGPIGVDQTTKASLMCDTDGTNCCSVVANSAPFCCNGAINLGDQAACLANLRANSP